MKIIKAASLTPEFKNSICHLWNNEYPKQLNITPSSFDDYLRTAAGQTHFLIINSPDELAGWAHTFDRKGERWFTIIIDHYHQRTGLGKVLLNLMKEKESELHGWVIDHLSDIKQNGEPYLSPLSFYIQNGFTAFPEIRFEDEKISALKIKWEKV